MWGSEDEHKPIIAALTYYQKIDVLMLILELLHREGKATPADRRLYDELFAASYQMAA